VATAIVLALLVTQSAIAAESAKNVSGTDASPAAVRAAFALPDTAGEKHGAAEWRAKKAVLVFFIAAECPVSNFYSPDFARIAHEYGDKGILTYGVHCDEDLTAAAAADHAKEFGLKFPVLLDPKMKLAAAVGARTTPEAFVLSPEGAVLYHGRIDDRFALNGKRRDEPTKHELEDALRAIIAGKKVEVTESKPYGCPLQQPDKRKAP
jgi:peroxiredoxin